MKKSAFAIPAFAALLAAVPAHATYEVMNKIRSVDPVHHEVRLRDGLYYEFTPDVDLAGFKPGDWVTVIVHQYNDNMGLQCHAVAITKVKPPRDARTD